MGTSIENTIRKDGYTIKDGAYTGPVKLGAMLGDGANGLVFSISPRDGAPYALCAKIFIDRDKAETRAERIATMVANAPKDTRLVRPDGQQMPQFAWPEGSIFDDKGRFAGYIMIQLSKDWEDLSEILLPSASTLSHIPAIRFAQLATNIAAIYTKTHRAGYRIVDGNSENFFVHKTEFFVCAIDCDNFAYLQGNQLIHAAEGVADANFYSPEQIEHGSANALPVQTEAHDTSILAQYIYKLLFDDYPFVRNSNIPSLPKEPKSRRDRTLAGLFQYANAAPSETTWKQGNNRHFDMPNSSLALFRRAFTTTDKRPTAKEWFTHLKNTYLAEHDFEVAPKSSGMAAEKTQKQSNSTDERVTRKTNSISGPKPKGNPWDRAKKSAGQGGQAGGTVSPNPQPLSASAMRKIGVCLMIGACLLYLAVQYSSDSRPSTRTEKPWFEDLSRNVMAIMKRPYGGLQDQTRANQFEQLVKAGLFEANYLNNEFDRISYSQDFLDLAIRGKSDALAKDIIESNDFPDNFLSGGFTYNILPYIASYDPSEAAKLAEHMARQGLFEPPDRALLLTSDWDQDIAALHESRGQSPRLNCSSDLTEYYIANGDASEVIDLVTGCPDEERNRAFLAVRSEYRGFSAGADTIMEGVNDADLRARFMMHRVRAALLDEQLQKAVRVTNDIASLPDQALYNVFARHLVARYLMHAGQERDARLWLESAVSVWQPGKNDAIIESYISLGQMGADAIILGDMDLANRIRNKLVLSFESPSLNSKRSQWAVHYASHGLLYMIDAYMSKAGPSSELATLFALATDAIDLLDDLQEQINLMAHLVFRSNHAPAIVKATLPSDFPTLWGIERAMHQYKRDYDAAHSDAASRPKAGELFDFFSYSEFSFLLTIASYGSESFQDLSVPEEAPDNINSFNVRSPSALAYLGDFEGAANIISPWAKDLHFFRQLENITRLVYMCEPAWLKQDQSCPVFTKLGRSQNLNDEWKGQAVEASISAFDGLHQ